MSLPIASGMNLATRSLRSQLVASRVMISTILRRMERIWGKQQRRGKAGQGNGTSLYGPVLRRPNRVSHLLYPLRQRQRQLLQLSAQNHILPKLVRGCPLTAPYWFSCHCTYAVHRNCQLVLRLLAPGPASQPQLCVPPSAQPDTPPNTPAAAAAACSSPGCSVRMLCA